MILDWILSWFTPTVDKAIAGLVKAGKALDEVTLHHSMKASDKTSAAEGLLAEATKHKVEAYKANAISVKIKALTNGG